MSTAIFIADWFMLGRDIYYRKFELYNMNWSSDVNLENYSVTSAQCGGPIAVKRDSKKIVKESGQPIISIFSCSGNNITSFKWTRRPIVKMGWSNEEKFVCIQEDGMIVIHDIFGKFLHTFLISQRAQELKVVDAKLFTSPQNCTGVAVLTSNDKVFLVNNILDPKCRQLSELPKGLKPYCWVVIAEEPQTEILMACGKELYRLKQDEHHTSVMLEPDISNEYTTILKMSVSFNARHIALFTDSGHLWLGSSNFRSKYCEIDTEVIYTPKQLIWCGNEAVVAYWERSNTILVVGIHGQKMTFTYDGSVHIVQEIDGVRIISNNTHELLQKVPHVVQKIFRINSTEPGSFLLEASKQFQKRSHRANEYISLVKKDLLTAVEQCIDAVGYEFDPEIQKRLVRAAQFGKCFISNANTEKYVNMCRLLRVLNEVRNPRIGIPITMTQLTYLTNKVLLDRLITRKEYYLALQIAKYLRMPDREGKNHILVHWAKYKVNQSQMEEETVAREIAEKLGYTPGISYSEVAYAAAECGKKKIAIKLLDYESKASEQINLLLLLGETSPALVKAIQSGDMDLVYTVILKLRDNMALGDFKMTIRAFPISQALYIKYCKKHNIQALNEIYIQEDDFASQAEMFILQSMDDEKSHMKDSFLSSAAEAYRKGRKDLYASMCEESLRLVRYQREIEDTLNSRNEFQGKSVHETFKLLLEKKEYKHAEKLKNDFKMSDRRYFWLKIHHLAEIEDWVELEKFSKMKKGNASFAAYVDVCLEFNNKNEALKYLPKVSDSLKVKYYTKTGCLEEAAKIAYAQKDAQGLQYVQSKCVGQPVLYEKINGMITQLDLRR
ncbi:vacuolar protein sorting-associated protein 16 homolog [Coccinella septempunctata]|uniref:vacuolar protein sorting-associated protein 16 homolog n=1 Tax=Coccinella septempunctata TaxID=41139 RepID=UPI001D07B8B2|nr:vacuolar protein sorting-associated protein 16 homolog [Coccinella septempunctata]